MKRIDIELLLTWAYLDELVKGGDGSSGSLWNFMPRGSFNNNKLPAWFGECHPDAIMINRAVLQLPSPAPALVLKHATLGTRPDWHPEQIQIKPVHKGTKVHVVGTCKGKNLYTLGSYCPLRWVPSQENIRAGRLEYQIWWQALLVLTSVELREHVATGPSAPRVPWITPPTTTRVLSSMKGS